MTASEILSERCAGVGRLTLNRPSALNALNLAMIRTLTHVLLAWRDDPAVQLVALRGAGKTAEFGSLCAGGDIRYFYQALKTGDPSTEDFFTEEYTLNHLIQTYPKPLVAFMDGVVMGGGMGLCQGASDQPDARGKWRLVTPASKLAMPETLIGLFPDVGGGYFLSRCPGHVGEWLALTGTTLGAGDAIAVGWADACVNTGDLPALWAALPTLATADHAALAALVASFSIAASAYSKRARDQIDHYFCLADVGQIVQALEQAGAGSDAAANWARQTAAALRQRSPLMLAVTLAQVRHARALGLADALRLERGLVRHSFYPQHLGRSGAKSETFEGIRARVVDKDNAPRWNPPRIEDVTPEMVEPFFTSPWPVHAHPLRGLGG